MEILAMSYMLIGLALIIIKIFDYQNVDRTSN